MSPNKVRSVTITEAALRAQCTRQTIHDALQAGHFPGAKHTTDQPNSPILIPLNELEQWMRTRKRRPKNA